MFFNFKQFNFFLITFFSFTSDLRDLIKDETSSAATFGAILKQRPEVVNMRGGKYNKTLLMDAAFYDRADIVHILINNGCDVGARDFGGWSAYHDAALHNSRTSLSFLLKHDASHVDDVE